MIKYFSIGRPALILAVFFIIAIGGCNQYAGLAVKNYQSGNYDASVRYAVKALRKKPTNKKAQQAIVPAYKAAINMYESKIGQLKAASMRFTGDETVKQRSRIVELYTKLIDMQNEVKSLPPIVPKKELDPITFKFKDYSSELLTARSALIDSKSKAAEMHYQEGLRLMQSDKLEMNKKAALEFKKAETFVNPYKNAAELYEQAREAGTKRIAVIPFKNKSGKTKYGAVGEIQSDLITAALINDAAASEFIDVISRDQLENVLREQRLNDYGYMDENSLVEVGKVLGVHEMIVGKITQIATNYPKTVSRSFEETNRVVVEKKEYFEDGKKKYKNIYGDVKARVTEYRKVATAKIIGSYSVIDVKTARLIKSDTFSEQYKFESTWGKYSGDKRALSDNARNLCNRQERIAPSAEEMVNKVSESLANKLAQQIIEWAK